LARGGGLERHKSREVSSKDDDPSCMQGWRGMLEGAETQHPIKNFADKLLPRLAAETEPCDPTLRSSYETEARPFQTLFAK
jgi:hypothetical protein